MKLLSLFVCLSLFTLSANAQISIGPKFGINIATAGGDDAPDGVESVIGLQFGAAAEIGINEMFAIQPELLFFQKGAKLDILGTETDQHLNYLEIPILAKARFGDAEGTQFFATLGPSLGFGLGGKIKAGDQEADIDFEDDGIKKFDFAISIGAGVQLPAGPGNLFFDARYLLGLTSTDDSGADADINNRGIGIALGYLFPLGGN